MSEQLRALVVILFLTGCGLFVAHRAFVPRLFRPDEFKRLALCWVAVPAIGIVSGNFWIFCLAASIMVWRLRPTIEAPVILLFLLLVMPPLSKNVDGIPGLPWLVQVSYQRLLLWVLALPLLFSAGNKQRKPVGAFAADWFILLLVLYQFVLRLTVDSVTNSARYAIDDLTFFFLPYWLCSRYIVDRQTMLKALAALVAGSLVCALIGAFELSRGWILYASLNKLFDIGLEFSGYLPRGDTGLMRAMAMLVHPLILGLLMSVVSLVAVGLLAATKPKGWPLWAIAVILLAGSASPLSRGPWLGFGVGLVAWQLLGPRPMTSLLQMFGVLLVAAVLVVIIPQGQFIIDLLPWVGNVEQFNVEYRQRLIEASLMVYMEDPWFGSFDFLYHPILQPLRIGDGIIDLVNTYLVLALSAGAVGVFLFVMSFVAAAWRAIKHAKGHAMAPEVRGLLAALVAYLLIIGTTSSISLTPIIGAFLTGLLLATTNWKHQT